ncbi:Dual specificity tyrosine-phosphorylation-regulated kinase [Corchorus olitorius]|uniref:Dual specificity tyrosine-phosphorylation-regulated kinase n=1 Tax=Corchorus olitorius TaxID=93759 RepID=A0A1R3GHZ8_9ROSI|nr:Dual specificity tyrosine-phosphorylation-regulated kinase [Corchorus olitorius]
MIAARRQESPENVALLTGWLVGTWERSQFQNLALFRPINRRSSRLYIGECRQRSIAIGKLAQGFAVMEMDTDDNAIREESGAVDRSFFSWIMLWWLPDRILIALKGYGYDAQKFIQILYVLYADGNLWEIELWQLTLVCFQGHLLKLLIVYELPKANLCDVNTLNYESGGEVYITMQIVGAVAAANMCYPRQ